MTIFNEIQHRKIKTEVTILENGQILLSRVINGTICHKTMAKDEKFVAVSRFTKIDDELFEILSENEL